VETVPCFSHILPEKTSKNTENWRRRQDEKHGSGYEGDGVGKEWDISSHDSGFQYI